MVQEILKFPWALPLAWALSQSQAEFSRYDRLFVAEQDGYLLLFQPYLPLVVTDPALAFVDSYYDAYQLLYARKKQVMALVAEQYPNATGYHGSYKALLERLGLGTCLKNTLLFLQPFGTFFCVEIMDLLGRGAPEKIAEHRYDPACDGCGACARACPGGALTEDFDCQRCVRQWQFGMADLADADARQRIGNRVLGCNRCQLACPKNHDVVQKHRVPNADYRARFDLDEMARVCCAPNFKESYYAGIVGRNYAKPMKILGFVLSAMLHHDGAAHVDTVRECLAMGNPNAKPLLRQYLTLCGEKNDEKAED